MANSFQDLTQMVTPLIPSFIPQVFATTAAGLAVDVRKVGTNRINALMALGDATALTSLAVKIQASPDGTNGWVDIPGATFDTVTADPGVVGVVPQMIEFQLPKPSAIDAVPYQYIRAHGTLTGTSIGLCVVFLACRKYDEALAYVAAPGNDGNNVVN